MFRVLGVHNFGFQLNLFHSIFTKLFSLYKRKIAGITLTLVDTMDGLFTGGAFFILLLIKIRQYYYIVRLKNIDI